jgi:phosphatidylserine decarboxylase
MLETTKIKLTFLLPHHFLSWLFGRLAKCEQIWLKSLLIRLYIKFYPELDMTFAKDSDPCKYRSLNALFIRELSSLESRPLAGSEETIISPVDGVISQRGVIGKEQIQAKGAYFDLPKLLSEQLKDYFDELQDNNFITLYLSPLNYHHVHLPLAGKLLKMAYIPGRLFSVNQKTVNHIPQLFTRNERLAMVFETSLEKKMAIVMIGAMFVSGIRTANKIMDKPKANTLGFWDYTKQNISFSRGEEIGYFEFGSTVIVILPKNGFVESSEKLPINSKLKMGKRLGHCLCGDLI